MRFGLRDFEPYELIAREPGMRAFTVKPDGTNTTYVFPVRPEDIAALNSLALAINSHEPLPLEAGEA